MGDQAVTAAEVLKTSTSIIEEGIGGATITAGMVLYKDSANSDVLKAADCDGTALTATVAGIAVNGGGVGQPIKYIKAGDYDPGFTVVVGAIYVMGGTAGVMQLASDLAQDDYVTLIGVGTSASSVHLTLYNSGVQVPA